MGFLIVFTLISLCMLGYSQAADPECENLTKALVLEDDYSSIMGKWVFTEGIASHDLFTNILKAVNSSWIEFSPTALRETVILRQGNMLNGKCEFENSNATIKNSNIYATEKDVVSVGTFLPSCPDCHTISFTSQTKNVTIKTLYLFAKSPNIAESEKDLYWKQAECLGFKKEPQFSYDRVTEFCKDEKNNSSTNQTKPEPEKDP